MRVTSEVAAPFPTDIGAESRTGPRSELWPIARLMRRQREGIYSMSTRTETRANLGKYIHKKKRNICQESRVTSESRVHYRKRDAVEVREVLGSRPRNPGARAAPGRAGAGTRGGAVSRVSTKHYFYVAANRGGRTLANGP
ncbi:hypothetical protein EVAR_77531_1 [Eumeta japonica]|uniref:Uncharacterized protein n=1 Tax=Eumeta variegata TaxID=151549 RepID=A0A4C1T9Y7_EUMVA|nr:hypothetical protein EVAR_77531_1 [Eumeta japonica]